MLFFFQRLWVVSSNLSKKIKTYNNSWTQSTVHPPSLKNVNWWNLIINNQLPINISQSPNKLPTLIKYPHWSMFHLITYITTFTATNFYHYKTTSQTLYPKWGNRFVSQNDFCPFPQTLSNLSKVLMKNLTW